MRCNAISANRGMPATQGRQSPLHSVIGRATSFVSLKLQISSAPSELIFHTSLDGPFVSGNSSKYVAPSKVTSFPFLIPCGRAPINFRLASVERSATPLLSKYTGNVSESVYVPSPADESPSQKETMPTWRGLPLLSRSVIPVVRSVYLTPAAIEVSW